MKKSTIIKTLGIITAFSIAIPSAGILAKNALQSSASEYSITQTEEASELSNSISDNNAIYASGNSADTANNSLGDSADVIPGDLPENNPSDGMPGNPPEGNPPEGNPPDGMPGDPPEGNPPDKMPGGKGGQPGPGGSSSSVTYDASEIITSDTTETGKSISSDTADVSALIVSGSTVTEDSINISKTGSSEDGDNCNFYGQNAAVLAKDGAVLYISNADIYSNANGANGVFSYGGNGGKNGASGDGTTVYISDSTITTEGNGSGGIMTTGGGTTYATNLTITTSGQSSAAIRKSSE